jgi:arginine exporter protein ArgO
MRPSLAGGEDHGGVGPARSREGRGVDGALLAGVIAGLGVAMPLGAIGVLLVQEGILRGWRPAAAGATGVALVDLGYATAAVTAGTLVTTALTGHERTVRRVGAVVLLLVVARGLWVLRRPARDVGVPEPVGAAPAGRVLGRFVALTAVNPLTAIYFVVLTAGLGDRVSGAGRGAAFVLGVFAASLAWQLALAAAGSLAGHRLPPWARTATTLAGYALVTGYAVTLATG